MLTWILALFLLGAIFVFFEAFLPGGILGFIGGALLLAGVGVAFAGYGPVGGGAALLAAIAIVAGTLAFEFKVLPKTAFGQKFFLHARNDATATPAADAFASLVGRTARAETVLCPSGVVLVDGARHQAYSTSGYIEPATEVRVTGADAFRLTVARV